MGFYQEKAHRLGQSGARRAIMKVRPHPYRPYQAAKIRVCRGAEPLCRESEGVLRYSYYSFLYRKESEEGQEEFFRSLLYSHHAKQRNRQSARHHC